MRYWHPYTEEALKQVVEDGVGKLVRSWGGRGGGRRQRLQWASLQAPRQPGCKLRGTIGAAGTGLPHVVLTKTFSFAQIGILSCQVILPLYPQFSISTSGSSLRLIEALFKGDPAFESLQHTVIPSWCVAQPPAQAFRPPNCQGSPRREPAAHSNCAPQQCPLRAGCRSRMRKVHSVSSAVCTQPRGAPRRRYQRPGYVRAMADLIQEELDQFPDPEEVRCAWHCGACDCGACCCGACDCGARGGAIRGGACHCRACDCGAWQRR
jgi:hypothetical protein